MVYFFGQTANFGTMHFSFLHTIYNFRTRKLNYISFLNKRVKINKIYLEIIINKKKKKEGAA
jgi:hypothetical protein